MSCRRCSPAPFGIRSGPGCKPFVPASRPPNSSWQTRYARHFPNFSWLPQKAILSPNSSLSGRTQKICGLSAWLREQKDGLLSTIHIRNIGRHEWASVVCRKAQVVQSLFLPFPLSVYPWREDPTSVASLPLTSPLIMPSTGEAEPRGSSCVLYEAVVPIL